MSIKLRHAMLSGLAIAVLFSSHAPAQTARNAHTTRPAPQAGDWTARRPNIVVILCDDLGYGDVQCLNPTRGKIATPHIDHLARQGLTFTDAHASASVCSPSRYSLLTGRYSWRSKLKKGALPGTARPILDADRQTIATMLKTQGYTTHIVGKWHLGLELGADGYKDPIVDGPLQHGFDDFYGIAASLDMAPYAYIENGRFTEVPSVTKFFGFGVHGPGAPSFEAVDVLPAITRRTVDFVKTRKPDGEPFFLYFALTSPHTPLLPSPEWVGKSGLGPYGDFVMQTDDSVGQVLAALDAQHLTDSTLVLFTSDNGCAPYVGLKELNAAGHYPSGPYRGYKADVWEGGHRIPFIVRWPGVVAPGTTSDVTIGQVDVMASVAQITGATLDENVGEDSVSLLGVFRGRQTGAIRDAEIYQTNEGNFAIRQGKWKLDVAAGSGGWSEPHEDKAHRMGLPKVQLYDMSVDAGEQTNLQDEYPEKVNELLALLQRYIDDGRSTPGPRQKNFGPVDLWALPAPAKEKPATRAITH